jgi:hypothetical protein
MPGHPRLSYLDRPKTWKPGTSPGMTTFADYAAAFEANPALQPADFKAIG